jgi:hypothetical protein
MSEQDMRDLGLYWQVHLACGCQGNRLRERRAQRRADARAREARLGEIKQQRMQLQTDEWVAIGAE